MALDQIPDVDVSKSEEVCVWPELFSSCCFLQKQGAGFPRATVQCTYTVLGERAMSNWNPSYTPEPPKAMGNLQKRANVSEEWTKPPLARPKHSICCLVPFPGDLGTNCWCFCTAVNGSLTAPTTGTLLRVWRWQYDGDEGEIQALDFMKHPTAP